MKTTPLKHQQEDLESSWFKESYAFFWEMGLGKSKVAIDTLERLIDKYKVRCALIVSDKGSYLNWIGELERHADFTYRVEVYRAGSPPRIHQKCSPDIAPSVHILLINTEAFSQSNAFSDKVESFLQRHKQPGTKAYCVVDESTSIKTHSSKRSKAVAQLTPHFEFRRIMTGTPAVQAPLDLWGQFRFLKPKLFSQSFYAFRQEFAVLKRTVLPGDRVFDLVVGYKNQDELAALIKPYSSRRTKEECLDLPDKIYEIRKFPMNPEQQKIYRQLSETYVADILAGKLCTAESALTAVSKLRQIACGRVPLDDGTFNLVGDNRLESFMSIAANHDGKMLVWCAFRADVDAVVQALKDEYGEASTVQYHGGVSSVDRESAVKKFTEDKECRFFVATAKTGGKGLTLVQANLVVYYSSDYSLESRLQSEDRAHRIGQTRSVTYVDIVADGSIDEEILENLSAKQDLSNNLMGLLRKTLCLDPAAPATPD